MSIESLNLKESVKQAEDVMMASLPDESTLLEHEFSAEFKSSLRNIYDNRKKRSGKKHYHLARKICLAAVVLLAVSISVLMSVEASRNKIISIIRTIFTGYDHYDVSSDINGAFKPFDVELTYLPDGMTVTGKTIFEEDYSTMIMCTDEDSKILTIDVNYVTDKSSIVIEIGREGSVTENIFINGNEATLNQNKFNYCLMWSEGNYFICVIGSVEYDDMISIAEGIEINERDAG